MAYGTVQENGQTFVDDLIVRGKTLGEYIRVDEEKDVRRCRAGEPKEMINKVRTNGRREIEGIDLRLGPNADRVEAEKGLERELKGRSGEIRERDTFLCVLAFLRVI